MTVKQNITLTGDRTAVSLMGTDPYDGTALGAKGIAIATGGTLSLQGRVLGASWTRLAKNVNPGINKKCCTIAYLRRHRFVSR